MRCRGLGQEAGHRQSVVAERPSTERYPGDDADIPLSLLLSHIRDDADATAAPPSERGSGERDQWPASVGRGGAPRTRESNARVWGAATTTAAVVTALTSIRGTLRTSGNRGH